VGIGAVEIAARVGKSVIEMAQPPSVSSSNHFEASGPAEMQRPAGGDRPEIDDLRL
jgi:hypothetical protein